MMLRVRTLCAHFCQTPARCCRCSRPCRLTYLLQGSLGDPKCKTLMICNLNPLHLHTQESLCTLRFAKTVSEVTTAGGAAAGGAGTKA